jgi:hypothetical protein
MNVAGAVGLSGDTNGDDNRNNTDSGPPTCPGYSEKSCDSYNNLGEKYASKREEFCNMAYIKKSAHKNVTCKWMKKNRFTNPGPTGQGVESHCAETQTECVVRNKAGY